MCDKESFHRLQDKVIELEKADVAQTEQIRTLFNATEKLEKTMGAVFTKIVWVFGIVLLLAILALVYGALGHDGFNAVAKAAATTQEVTK